VLVAAAVLPHPPLLVPQLATGDDDALDDLRRRCREAVAAVRTVDADVLFVVGADVGGRATTFAPWGADVPVDVPEPLPLPLLVGAWLTAGSLRSFVAVDADLEPGECAAVGADLATARGRVAMLVMGDGAARHTEKAPGYLDPRATGWDDEVHAALRDGDPKALADLDPDLAADLLVAGRAPWQVLSGATGGTSPGRHTAQLTLTYGVGYHVAVWL